MKRINLIFALVTLAVAGFITGSAQSRRAMTPEDVVSMNRASDTQISPDARRVAFVVSSWDKEADKFNTDLWLAYDTRQQSLRLTSHPKRDDHPRWAPDSNRLAFISDRDGDPQIFIINANGGEPVRLSLHKAPVLDFEWSPDGRHIAFVATEPREKEKTKPPVVVEEDHRFAQLWLIDTNSGQIIQLTKGERHIAGFNWSLDGERIVFTARSTPNLIDLATTEVYVTAAAPKGAPYDTKNARQLTSGNGAEDAPRFSPDGLWVSYLAHADNDPNVGPLRIHIIPAGGGTPRVLGARFDGYVRDYRWVHDGRRIIFMAGVGVVSRIYTMTLDDETPQAMTRDDGQSTAISTTYDGMNVAYVHENPRMPNEVVLLSARNMIPVLLTRLNPQLESVTLGQVETIRWKSTDGAEIEGVLVYPVGFQTGKAAPLVTYIHGGPEGAYTRSFNATWSAFPQIYAGRGYAVFMPNFRGSSNYGAAFAQANAGRAGKIDYDDIMTGIDHLVRSGIADENRLAVAGWSYGGYLSAWMIGHTKRFKCAAYGAGLSNAVSYWGTADIVGQRERLHGGTPWTARQMFDEQSPLTHLTKATTPTLIFHGEKDERVPLGQSQESFRTLKRLGVTVRLIVYPDQGHGLTVPSYQLDKIRRESDWIEKYIDVRSFQ